MKTENKKELKNLHLLSNSEFDEFLEKTEQQLNNNELKNQIKTVKSNMNDLKNRVENLMQEVMNRHT